MAAMVPLSEMPRLLGNKHFDTLDQNCKVFQWMWHKYKRSLISDLLLPSYSFLVYPQCQHAEFCSSFGNWKRANRFRNLLF